MPSILHSFYFVLINDRLATVIGENDTDKLESYEARGWITVFDSARSIREGREYAAMLHHAVDVTYTDPNGPTLMKEPKVLYKALSISELVDLYEHGTMRGRPDAINDFDDRPFLMFGDKISPQMIAMGDSLERQAEIALREFDTHAKYMEAWKAREYQASRFITAVQKMIDSEKSAREKAGLAPRVLDESAIHQFMRGNTLQGAMILQRLPMTEANPIRILNEIATIDSRLIDISQEYLAAEEMWIDAERSAREQYPYTSIIAQFAPLDHGYRYSKETGGVSELGDLDEYGFYPNSVASDHVLRLHCVLDGKIVKKIDLEDIPSFVQEMKDAMEYAQGRQFGMGA